MLSEEFTQEEIGEALKDAKELSAPGPSGQTPIHDGSQPDD